jgi:hypothetical protein
MTFSWGSQRLQPTQQQQQYLLQELLKWQPGWPQVPAAAIAAATMPVMAVVVLWRLAFMPAASSWCSKACCSLRLC